MALIKHGYDKFSLLILEYCEKEECRKREGFYIKLLNQSTILFRIQYHLFLQVVNTPMKRLKNCFHDTDLRSTERKYLKLRKDNKDKKDLVYLLTKYKKKNETTIYDSIREAAKALDIPNSSIQRNLKIATLYKDRYGFTDSEGFFSHFYI
jgi:hypothetical protein